MLAADPLEGRKRPVGRDGHDGMPMIDESRALEVTAVPAGQFLEVGEVGPALAGKLLVFLPYRLAHGGPQAAGHDRKLPLRGVTGHHGGILEAIDQLPPHLRVPRRHEFQPQARESRCEHGHGHHHPPESPLPGILPHDRAVGDLVWPADLKNPRAAGGQVDRGRKVGHHVVDRDRLGRGGEPGGADHQRQPLHERPHEVE